MELKKGYKQTEAGVIPEEWDAVPVKSITPQNRRNGIVDGPFGSNLKTIHYRTSGIPIITSGYVTDGKFHADKYLYVDRAKFLEEKRSAVQPGDIVMAKIGERCGASAILPLTHETGILSGNALKITVDESRHSTSYIWQVLWNLHVSGKLEVLRTTGAQPALSMANLKLFKIPVPPTKGEQDTIATALSDVDGLIGGLEQLIAKKRDLKRAAMQQLLTGKKRLTGFRGDWDTKRIGELLKYQRPDKYIVKSSDYLDNADTPVLTANKSFILGYTNEDFGIYADLPAIVFDDFTTDCKYVNFPFKVKSSAIKILKTRSPETNLKFVYERMRLLDFPLGEHKRYYISEFQHIEIPTPKPVEQTAIAEVLSDMDTELSALEQRRDKTRDLKQGIMQALLTGKTRLV